MQNRKISVRFLLVISIALLMVTNVVTYAMLLSKNEEWKTVLKKTKGGDTFAVASALTDHVYYDGDSISCNHKVKHYSRSGKLLGDNNLADLLQGDKVIMLISTNSCSTCTKEETGKLLELGKKIGRKNVVVIADYAMHKQPSWAGLLDKEGFYETEMEHLGLEGTPTRETPVVMLTHNGRILTSFIVGAWTTKYTGNFHKYLAHYFKVEK